MHNHSIQQNSSISTFGMEESTGSNSSPPHRYTHHRDDRRFNPTQPLAERVLRALGHRLRLLHRLASDFFILGATGNVYTVTLSTTPSCTCPDRTTPCKHILFVYIRVLGLSLDELCLWRRTLRPCQLDRLVNMLMSDEALAGDNLPERFHELFFRRREVELLGELEEGSACPICLENMERDMELVACGTCRNPVHEACLLAWKRSRRRQSTTCVICRSRWRDAADLQRYLNLSTYISDSGDMALEMGGHGGGTAHFGGGSSRAWKTNKI